jgi:hypothetical protein
MHELEVGDVVTIKMTMAARSAKIEFNKVVDPEGADWTGIVAATADESISAHHLHRRVQARHYNNRQDCRAASISVSLMARRLPGGRS